ncbi:TrkH family potassium uptake protein [Pseudoroseicyclus sp. CXY001]|uniref:TrkH family potassium uptake protein n=1 Tax=Pseudoroseicyclus sp. CXY001 TaxID=3242492 RepID=UPI0035709A32
MTFTSMSARLARAYRHLTERPARGLLIGYLAYMLAGWLLLLLPFSRTVPVAALDSLFIATSAVSTTGLVTVDPGSSYTFFGELVILALIQMGGLGYMTIGSFALIAVQRHLSAERERNARTAFELPAKMALQPFIASVVIFTLIAEAAGAAALYPMLKAAGVEAPLWSALFHAVSAFCTAGFSLFPTSLEAFSAHPGVVAVISALSLMGAMGFLIVVDIWRSLRRRRARAFFTTKIIVRITLAFLVLGTALLAIDDPVIAALPLGERLLAAFFQTMSAATTVGFDTVPIAALGPASIMALIVLMVIGASPAGTGGGLKTTSFAALFALVRATLRGEREVRFMNRRLPEEKIRTAAASLAYYAGVMSVAMILLLTTEAGQPFESVLFEAVSAIGTVGLSLGLTSELTAAGKLILIVLMTAGRLGILTFGIALAVKHMPEPGSETPPEPGAG